MTVINAISNCWMSPRLSGWLLTLQSFVTSTFPLLTICTSVSFQTSNKKLTVATSQINCPKSETVNTTEKCAQKTLSCFFFSPNDREALKFKYHIKGINKYYSVTFSVQHRWPFLTAEAVRRMKRCMLRNAVREKRSKKIEIKKCNSSLNRLPL